MCAGTRMLPSTTAKPREGPYRESGSCLFYKPAAEETSYLKQQSIDCRSWQHNHQMIESGTSRRSVAGATLDSEVPGIPSANKEPKGMQIVDNIRQNKDIPITYDHRLKKTGLFLYSLIPMPSIDRVSQKPISKSRY
jgi:hypothetical protein